MIQGSQEWHDFRRSKIGASDFALICANLGYSNNIFNKSIELSIKDKLDCKEFKDNYYTLKGKEYEPILLAYLKDLGIEGSQDVISYNDKIMASLDCYDKQNNILVEIKTTSKDKSKYDELINYYKYQVLHQYYTCNTKPVCYILIYNLVSKDLDLIQINCDEILNKEEWLNICYKYLDKMEEINTNKNNIDVIKLLEEREFIEEQIKELTEKKDNITNIIKNMYHETTVVGNYKITISNTRTAKYSDYIKNNNIILDDAYYTNVNKFIIKKVL